MLLYVLSTLVLLLAAMQVEAGEDCQYSFSTYLLSKYCAYGCCGDKYSSYSAVCCSSSSNSYSSYISYSTTASIGTIVGATFGGLAVLFVLMVIIKCTCAALHNSKRQTGTVIQPTNPNIHGYFLNATAVQQGQFPTPVFQGAVGNGYPVATSPPPYCQINNVPQSRDGVSDSSPPPHSQINNVSQSRDGVSDPSPPPHSQINNVSQSRDGISDSSPPPQSQINNVSQGDHCINGDKAPSKEETQVESVSVGVAVIGNHIAETEIRH